MKRFRIFEVRVIRAAKDKNQKRVKTAGARKNYFRYKICKIYAVCKY